ncbi:hypothetical protein HQ40_03750, partial [Porphyromonas gulae]
MGKDRKAEQEQSLKFTQLIVRSLLFLLGFTLFWLAILTISNVAKEELFLSEIPIVYTWLISLLLVITLWLVYLIAITKDTSLQMLWNTIRPVTSHSNEKFTKWIVFLIMLIT